MSTPGKKTLKESDKNFGPKPDYVNPKENIPYLGPWWVVLMLFLYGLKTLFPAEKFTLFWYFQVYVLLLFTIVTLFVVYKRWQHGRAENSNEFSNSDHNK